MIIICFISLVLGRRHKVPYSFLFTVGTHNRSFWICFLIWIYCHGYWLVDCGMYLPCFKKGDYFPISSLCTAFMISQRIQTCYSYWIWGFFFSWLRWIDSFITFFSLALGFSFLQLDCVLIFSVLWSLLTKNRSRLPKAIIAQNY